MQKLNYCMDFDFLKRQYIENINVNSVHSHKFLGAFRHHSKSKTGNLKNTPLVMAEMAGVLSQTPVQYWFFKLVSLLLRTTNPRYMFFRFAGKFFWFKALGKQVAKKISMAR